MTVLKLKEVLHQIPDHMEVVIYNEAWDFTHQPVATAEVQDVPLREDPNGPVLSREKSLVLKHQ